MGSAEELARRFVAVVQAVIPEQPVLRSRSASQRCPSASGTRGVSAMRLITG